MAMLKISKPRWSVYSEARITGIESVEQGYYRCATINPLAKKGSYVTVRATLPYS